jgi:hypothetical protein
VIRFLAAHPALHSRPAIIAGIIIVIVVVVMLRRASWQGPGAGHSDLPATLVAVAGLGGVAWYITRHHPPAAPAAAPAPKPTIIVHQVTRVIPAHSPVSGTDIVIMVVATLIIAMVVALNIRSRSE